MESWRKREPSQTGVRLGFTLDIPGAAIDVALRQFKTSEAYRALMHERLDLLRESLGEAEASQTEQLLIDQVVICYLRMNMTEQAYDNGMAGGCTFDAGSYWERRLSTVQRRYLRSIETLARVRKLMGVPMVQINIAAEGGQQVVSNA